MENAKSTRWAFTAYENQWSLFDVIPSIVAEWGWQTEKCPDTQRLHYQGYLRTSRQVRHSQLRSVLPGVHIEVARDWNKLLNYCKKKDTSIGGTQVNMVNPQKAMTMANALMRIASHAWTIEFDKVIEPEKWEKAVKAEYWDCVKYILRDDPDSVGLYTQPQYERAWFHTRDVWLEKLEEQNANEAAASNPAEEVQTDRQTDSASNLAE